MIRLMTIRLPRNAAASVVPRIPGLNREGFAKCCPPLVRRALKHLRLRLGGDMSGLMMILRNETGGLAALCDPPPQLQRGPKGARGRKDRVAIDDFASVDELVAGVVHEIRNPLTAIRMWMFSIQEGVDGDKDLTRRCALVGREISRLERMSQSFLEYARLPQMRVRPLKVPELLDEIMEVLSPYLESIPAKVRRCDLPYVPSAMADGEQLKQVFINLLTNAAESLDGEGEIFVSTDFEYGGSSVPMVVVRIRDTGPGMPTAVGERIAEPSTSSKHRGKGLGLYIAARITENHGGSLSIESSSGTGSTIAVRIPAVNRDGYGHCSSS